MSSFWLLISYCAAILVISVIGGLVPIFVRLTHTRMQVGLSFVSGVMLGVGLFHMLPHAVTTRLEAGGEAHGEVEASLSVLMLAVVGGFVVMFLVERFLCFHHHEVEEDDTAGSHGSPEGENAHAGHDHAHTHSHAHGSAHRFGWVGALVGLTIHTILSGVALGAAVRAADLSHGGAAIAGFGAFLGILLHKPFDAMTITALMRGIGKRREVMHLVNAGFALVVPVGVLLFELGAVGTQDTANFTALALAFSAGTFLCIAASDLLPELQFHDHDRIKLTVALLLGLAVAWASGLVEHGGHEEHDDHAVGVSMMWAPGSQWPWTEQRVSGELARFRLDQFEASIERRVQIFG